MSKKANKSQYDSQGRWIEERGRVKGAIRRAFRLSPQMKDTLQKARVELPPAIKKDGTPGKKPVVRYRCASCKDLFSQKHVQVDHIETVVPLWASESSMSRKEWIVIIFEGIMCGLNNLQVLCSTPMRLNGGKPSCHKQKTDEEMFVRRELSKVINIKDHSGEEISILIEEARLKYSQYVQEREDKKRKKEENARKRKAAKK